MQPPIPLKSDEIHVWFAFPNEIRDQDLLSAYEALLTVEESAKQKRFYFERHRHQYLITRALVRAMLSRYIETSPKLLRFSQNEYGKPELAEPGCRPPLRFNLSHADGIIVCAVVLDTDIGVDVEDMDRRGVTMDLAGRFFSPREAEDLARMPESRKRSRFFEFWTLKEAYIKARGMGLSIPLDKFSFQIPDNGSLSIVFEPELNDTPGKWQFWLLAPTPRHKVALAFNRSDAASTHLRIRKVVPLRSEDPLDCPIIGQSSRTPPSLPLGEGEEKEC